jgi:hypothetical protein
MIIACVDTTDPIKFTLLDLINLAVFKTSNEYMTLLFNKEMLIDCTQFFLSWITPQLLRLSEAKTKPW